MNEWTKTAMSRGGVPRVLLTQRLAAGRAPGFSHHSAVDRNVAAGSWADSKYDPLTGNHPNKEEPGMKRNPRAFQQATANQSHTCKTIGIDLGDRWSRYCVLDGTGR
jgi:hypothetical protein